MSDIRDKVPEVQPGRPMLASAQNRFIRSHNALLRGEVGAVLRDSQIDILFRAAEIESLDFANTKLLCIEPGTAPSTDTFDVYLPDIYTETSHGTGSNYVYTSLNQRTASGAAGPTETQFLTPPLIIGERIFIAFNDDIGDYEMIADGRMWGVD